MPRLALALALLLAAAAPAAAADGPLLAGSSYWNGFVEFWTGAVRKQNGIVLLTLGVGAVCLFILTRSKAKKG